VSLTSEGGRKRTLVYKSDGKPRGGVVLIHGGNGLDPNVIRMAKRLALVGYAIIGPDMYHREKGEPDKDVMARIAQLTWSGAKADLSASMAWLTTNANVDSGKIAVLGFCMGGALAWLAGAEMPFKTAVLYYPHDIFKPFGKDGVVPFDVTPKVPVLGQFGADDTNPSPEDAKKLAARLSEKNTPQQFYHYQGAGHGFVGANPQLHRQIQANTSIDRTIGWLDMHLIASKAGGFFLD